MNASVADCAWCDTDRPVSSFFVGVGPFNVTETFCRRGHSSKDIRHFAWFVSFPLFPALEGLGSNLGAQCRRSDQVMRQCVPQRYRFHFPQAADKEPLQAPIASLGVTALRRRRSIPKQPHWPRQ